MNYIFPLDLAESWPESAGLAEMRAFLAEPEDGETLCWLAGHGVPLSFEVRKFGAAGDLRAAFLCVSVDLPAQAAGVSLDRLPPHIWAMLARGWESGSLPRGDAGCDEAEICRRALASDTLFVAQGHYGTSRLFCRLVGECLGAPPAAQDRLTVGAYKKRLGAALANFSRGADNYRLLHRLETMLADFEQRAVSYDGGARALRDAYSAAAEMGEYAELSGIGKLLEETALAAIPKPEPGCGAKSETRRLAFGLPRSPAHFEDNGAALLEDVLERLEGFPEHCELAARLRQLAGAGGRGGDWFFQLAKVRRALLVALSPAANPFMPAALQSRIASCLRRLAAKAGEETAAGGAAGEIIAEYLGEVTEELLDKYRRPFDGTRPFVQGGLAIIDMEACADDAAIAEALSGARKVIAIGGHPDGLFRLMLLAADERRYAFFGKKTRQIQRLWYYPRSMDLAGFILQRTESGQSVGVMASNPAGLAGQLGGAGVGAGKYRIGSLGELYSEEFDALVWYPAAGDGQPALSQALSRARETLAVVLNPAELHVDSPLIKFYHSCADGDSNGRIYR